MMDKYPQSAAKLPLPLTWTLLAGMKNPLCSHYHNSLTNALGWKNYPKSKADSEGWQNRDEKGENA